MQREQIIVFIRTVPIFHALEGEQLNRLADSFEDRLFDIGDVAVERNQSGDELFVVVEGEFRATLPHEKQELEKELARLYPGDYFGVMALVTSSLNTATIQAVTSSRALVLKREAVDSLFESSPAFARAICRSLALNVSESLEKIPPIPFVKLDSFPNLAKIAHLIPPRISRHCECLAVDQEDDLVHVAMVNANDSRARVFIADVLKPRRVEFMAISEGDFRHHAQRVLGAIAGLSDPAETISTLQFVNAQGNREPIAQTSQHDLLPQLLVSAIRDVASDIHVEPGEDGGRVRFRIDGRLIAVEEHVPPSVMRQILSRIKVMAELDITNIRRPQDGRFMVLADDRRYEFRVSVLPCQGGEKAVLRLIVSDSYLGNIRNLIVFENVAEFAAEVFQQPSGLVLVTGPTGSGKTTTLYAALNLLNFEDHTRNIVTIEDPVEYELPYATQTQVNREIGLDFAEILKTVLRQDPDTILVGEMRDPMSAAIAVEAAATGHLVLSSLHTDSTLEAIVRLRNLEVKPYLLANAIKGVVSQKLVPRLHPGCSVPVPQDDPVIGQLQRMGILEEGFSETLHRGHAGEGCPPDGESGRMGVFEVQSITDEFRDLIDRSAPLAELESALKNEAFFPMRRYARMLLGERYVSPDRIAEIFPKRATFLG